MTDYIEREAVLLALLEKGQRSRRYRIGDIWELNFKEIKEALKDIPAADVRPVVMCRDCKWCHSGYCEKYDDLIPFGCADRPWEDWFCADGERPNCGADMRGGVTMADYTELLEELRLESKNMHYTSEDCALFARAADAIDELREDKAALNEIVSNLLEQIKSLAIPRWIPVDERLPDFEGAVLCLRKSYIHPGVKHQEIMYVDEHGFCNKDDIYAEPGNVTHWMPLPEPPKEDT